MAEQNTRLDGTEVQRSGMKEPEKIRAMQAHNQYLMEMDRMMLLRSCRPTRAEYARRAAWNPNMEMDRTPDDAYEDA